MPVLDRIPSIPDPIRSEQYNVADIKIGRRTVAELEPRPFTWFVPFHLNQGKEGACVPHGCIHEAVAKPKPVLFRGRELPDWAWRARSTQAQDRPEKEIAQALAFDAYDWCRRNDEWPGENYDGTSSAAGARMMKLI